MLSTLIHPDILEKAITEEKEGSKKLNLKELKKFVDSAPPSKAQPEKTCFLSYSHPAEAPKGKLIVSHSPDAQDSLRISIPLDVDDSS